MLIKGEADGSSFPSGGLRSTFEARGYTAWDVTSPAYLMENPSGIILCIPTVFLSWTGVALDKKTPLLRSNQALNKQASRLLKVFGIESALPVIAYAGLEQEYFLSDRHFAFARPDIHIAGRALFGAHPAKGQEFGDQYYGVIPHRVLAFMMEVDHELYKLGVPVKTRHNEAAPSQYEIAPLFEAGNLATDHNHLIMLTLHNVAKRHGMVCLLHEKPFAGINGSGKHLNYSLGNAHIGNMFEPGDTPHENAKFLVFCAALIRGVHKYGGLLRATVASAGNDHRLGANEAPPAIMSIFLGDQLTDVFEQFRAGRVRGAKKGRMMHVGVDTLPPLSTDPGDRNRTSPLAFVGNRFEFRPIGASMSPADSLTALNVIMADSLGFAADCLARESKGSPDKLHAAVQSFIQHVIEEHSAVIFNGDGYSEVWHKEAARRGLPNLRSSPDAMRQFCTPEALHVFAEHQVLNKQELKARQDIYFEQYCKSVRTEARLATRTARTIIYPAAMRYQGELAATCAHMKAIDMEYKAVTLNELTVKLRAMQQAVLALEHLLDSMAVKDLQEEARYCCDQVLPAMNEVRRWADALEGIVADDRWALPSYQEMLFIK
jgi:glutamine synthetase